MNIIRMIKNARRQAEFSHELKEKLEKIPESRLNGIQTLPVELWSEIIGSVLDQHMQHTRRQCYSIHRVLELRLVCHAFDEEIQRALHQRLTLPQIQRYCLLAYDMREREPRMDCSLRNALFASALYRETQGCSGNKTVHFMAYRLKNCVLVAQHLSSNHTMKHGLQLCKTFCTAASTSRCCWSYTSVPQYVNNLFIRNVGCHDGTARECDILLEVSLLVANGYQLTDVKRWMIRLGRLGLLVGYREHVVRHCEKPATLQSAPLQRPYIIDGPCGPSSHPYLSEEEIGRAITQPYDASQGDGTWQDELERELDEELERMERQVLSGVSR